MAPASPNTDRVSFESISEKMSRDRGGLLAVIARSDGGIETGELRREVGVPSGSMHYHMKALRDWNLIEIVGEGEGNGSIPPKVYDVTERGIEFLDRPTARTIPSAEEIDELHQRVEELSEQVENQRNQIVELIHLLDKRLEGSMVEDIHSGTGGDR
jgi:DNA-binding transcriptional regulator GbsR (MarR family)